MIDLFAEIDTYLTMRRGLGFKLEDAGSLLPDFVNFLHRNNTDHVTTELAVAWAVQPVNADRIWWRQRLGFVRGFAQYLQNLDPRTQVPPSDLIPAQYQRIAPYLYSQAEIDSLMAATGSLNPPLRAATFHTFIGLIAVTGLRRGEALALNRDDLDHDQLALNVKDANGGRTIPVHESTVVALQRYFDAIDQQFPVAVSPAVFVSTRGTRLNKNSITATFPGLIDAAGLTGRGQRSRPRLHDLRHSYAIRQLIEWHTQHVDVDARIPLPSAVLGHSDPASTYWYLQASPELFASVAQRLEQTLGDLP